MNAIFPRVHGSGKILAALDLLLDIVNQRALMAGTEVRLRPKAFATLHHLMMNPGRLVTKQELLSVLWPDAQVQASALKVCIREVRLALGEEAQSPRFIRTVGNLGYWFIPEVMEHARHTRAEPAGSAEPEAQRETDGPRILVGRGLEVAFLEDRLAQACLGERQLVFVTGEAGIGKTSLINAFLDSLKGRSDVRSALGQCHEQLNQGEAYLPVLEALGELCRPSGGILMRKLLRQYAPTWLLQLPALLEPEQYEVLRAETIGATPERMLREMAEALEAMSAEHTLVLVLEDLHWSDRATLDLIAYLGRRRRPARLLLLGLFRPNDALQQDHPLNSLLPDLRVQQRCVDLPLRPFNLAEVAAYLQKRLGQLSPAELGMTVWRRTQGNPALHGQRGQEAGRASPCSCRRAGGLAGTGGAAGAPEPAHAGRGSVEPDAPRRATPAGGRRRGRGRVCRGVGGSGDAHGGDPGR